MNVLGLSISVQRSSAAQPWTRRSVAAGVVGALALGGGAAYAFWSSTGAGTAQAKSRTAIALTATAVTPTTGDLYPGSTGAVSFTLQNSNTYGVNITKLTSATVVSDDVTNCPNTNISITAGAIPSGGLIVNYTINANSTSATQTLPGLLTMNVSAPDGCQTKTFSATLNFTGSQV